MLSELKNFRASSMDLEELVELSAKARLLETEFGTLGVDVPEWVGVQIASLRREVKSRNAESLANKLATLKARRAAIATPDEKRAKVDQEIAELEAKVSA
jgi:hypothetical protein